MHTEADGVEYEQRTLRRLHSQQLRVPLRILRRLASVSVPSPEAGDSTAVSGTASILGGAA